MSRASSVCALVLVFLSGCTESDSPAAAGDEGDPIVHTRPDDGVTLNDPDRFHLHDYWGGADTLLLMDETRGTSVTSMGQGVLREQFRPEAGKVVPLGTGNVSVTLSWTLDPGSTHGDVWLYVKTQADNVSQRFSVVQSDEPVVFPSTNPQNDLPHQTLSAWSFDLYLTPSPETGLLRFNGDVSVAVTVERGLGIPLFPPHQDRWGNETELPLFSDQVAAGQIDHYPAPNKACTGGCLPIHVPVDGAIVPLGADAVRVALTVEEGAQGDIRLAYHRADSRAWTETGPTETNGAEWVFVLPVEGAVDGPYASSSLWEFQVVSVKTQDNGWFYGSYRMDAVAVRGAAA